MLLCYSCQEVITQPAYHDSHFQAICSSCGPHWPDNLADLVMATDSSNADNTPLESAYQDFLSQKTMMEQFFGDTKSMKWTLATTHCSYYQAEAKIIALAEADWVNVKQLVHQHRKVDHYPSYTFRPPGRIVNSRSKTNTLVKTVVSNQFWDYIVANQNKPWDWAGLSFNCNCDLASFRRYPELPWNIPVLSRNPNVNLEWLQAYPELPWDWSCGLSANCNLQLSWLQTYPDKPWHTELLSNQANFAISWIAALSLPLKNWSWYDISRRPNLEWSWIELYPEANWDYFSLSHRVPLDYFSQHLTKAWNPNEIATRTEFTLAVLSNLVTTTKNPKSLKLLSKIIACHPQLDLKWLQHFQDLDLPWLQLTGQANFTWQWVEALPDKAWNWSVISQMVILS